MLWESQLKYLRQYAARSSMVKYLNNYFPFGFPVQGPIKSMKILDQGFTWLFL